MIWPFTKKPRTDRNEAPDCEGLSPCATCQDERECGSSGCVRIARASSPAGRAKFDSDDWRQFLRSHTTPSIAPEQEKRK